ncbi:hypothetical protein HPB50_018669 [Hyalomma asiaticum]|uniref:Uncharacterized protein n=1 Tax=Hyalomma asiaticum TaxID=266040 RepID=A0ACB7SJG8_HYAAI|nr:hypothetical protein HPB50_018669 [Hyalomma asiaticum]
MTDPKAPKQTTGAVLLRLEARRSPSPPSAAAAQSGNGRRRERGGSYKACMAGDDVGEGGVCCVAAFPFFAGFPASWPLATPPPVRQTASGPPARKRGPRGRFLDEVVSSWAFDL